VRAAGDGQVGVPADVLEGIGESSWWPAVQRGIVSGGIVSEISACGISTRESAPLLIVQCKGAV